MPHSPQPQQILRGSVCGLAIASQLLGMNPSIAATPVQSTATCQSRPQQPNFLVFGGGGNPASNEIAIEKNVLYFQRTLNALGYNPNLASIFFANGNNGQATVRYLDEQRRERYKVPEIPNLNGAATLTNLQRWMRQTARQRANKPIFFYFTGHGTPNKEDINNNHLALWNEQLLSVKQFTQMLDKLPRQTPVVTMMAQCFSGSFANFIYEGGDPKRPVALQTRCGFFATIKNLPSVGCTPEVNEADYRDYSSSFFAGLSGRDRVGKTVASADYNQDGKVSYAEAHAFAKIDDHSTDLPISTSESWLQDQASNKDLEDILRQPINKLVLNIRPEQRYVVNFLVQKFQLDAQRSFLQNLDELNESKINTADLEAEFRRLGMELVNVGMENKIRSSNNKKAIATLDRLIKCESGSWRN